MSVFRKGSSYVNVPWTPLRHCFWGNGQRHNSFKYDNNPDRVDALMGAYIIMHREEWNHVSDNVYEFPYNGNMVVVIDNGKTVNINGKDFKSF